MDIPVFDFTSNPWLALVQLALVVILPVLVGLVTDRLSAGWLKVLLLGGLTFISTVLTALGVELSGGEAVDWPNVVGNGVITWLFSIGAYFGILKPVGVIDAAQKSSAIQLFGPSAKRVEDQKDAVG